MIRNASISRDVNTSPRTLLTDRPSSHVARRIPTIPRYGNRRRREIGAGVKKHRLDEKQTVGIGRRVDGARASPSPTTRNDSSYSEGGSNPAISGNATPLTGFVGPVGSRTNVGNMEDGKSRLKLIEWCEHCWPGRAHRISSGWVAAQGFQGQCFCQVSPALPQIQTDRSASPLFSPATLLKKPALTGASWLVSHPLFSDAEGPPFCEFWKDACQRHVRLRRAISVGNREKNEKAPLAFLSTANRARMSSADYRCYQSHSGAAAS